MTVRNTNRRAILTGVAAAVGAAGLAGQAKSAETSKKKVYRTGPKPATPPPYSTGVSLGNLLFLSGIVCRTPGDIKAHTEFALGEMKKQLEAAGSSMQKVLRCTVFLADIKDFAAMNEVYTGKFGEDPPARTTVAVAGISANSLIEIDAIAYI
ncbi:MAG TPA: RidA family protein [Bryobacteraceae bacterium]|jgi:reactive intermediate/imine deaminase